MKLLIVLLLFIKLGHTTEYNSYELNTLSDFNSVSYINSQGYSGASGFNLQVDNYSIVLLRNNIALDFLVFAPIYHIIEYKGKSFWEGGYLNRLLFGTRLAYNILNSSFGFNLGETYSLNVGMKTNFFSNSVRRLLFLKNRFKYGSLFIDVGVANESFSYNNS